MAVTLDIGRLYDLLINEILNDDFTKLDESFFENIVLYFKQNKNNNSPSTINTALSYEEKTIILSLIKKLLEVRSRKLFLDSSKKLTLSNLTLEEHFLYDPIIKFKRNIEVFLKDIEMGHANKLEEIKKKVIKKTVLVRIYSDIPKFVGVDLKNYGPLEPEDVTILPNGNIEPFLNKLSVSGGWAESIENP